MSDTLTTPNWHLSQVFGTVDKNVPINEADLVTAVSFDPNGDYLAAGDKGGRCVLFRKETSKRKLEFSFIHEFVSHEPEFDYLKSLEIEEKINKIRFLRCCGDTIFLLVTNEKTMKLWKVHNRRVKTLVGANIGPSEPGSPVNVLKVPRVLPSTETVRVSTCSRVFKNAHAFHINSISVNSDQETFLSADDLRINLWNFNVNSQSFNIVDIKPENMDELAEVITCAEFHPLDCSVFSYSTSKGVVKLGDLRQSALCDSLPIRFQEQDNTNSSFFSEVLASISDLKFSPDGRYLVARDYLTVKIWDVKMERQPVQVIRVHDHLKPKLCDLYENECIFDKFECSCNCTATSVATGSYGNQFGIFDITTGQGNTFCTDRPTLSPEDQNADFLDYTRKAQHIAFHPCDNLLALTVVNNLFLFTG